MNDERDELAALIASGRAAFEAGRFREARDRMSRALPRDPDNRLVRFVLGAAQYHLGNSGEARRQLEPLMEGAPPLPERRAAVPEYLSRCALGQDPDLALLLARTAIARDGGDPRAHLAAGHALARLRQHPAALAAYDRAWELEGGPNGPTVLPFARAHVPYARCLALCDLEEWTRALDAAGQAIARDGTFAPAFNQRGLILQELGRTAEAATSFQHAIDLDPETRSIGGDGSYYFNLASVLARLDRRGDARHALTRALALSPQPRYKALALELGEAEGDGGAALDPVPAVATPGVVTFANVGGMAALKQEVTRIVDTVYRKRGAARRYGIVRNGILLFGPPGCGKTFFAEAMAGQFGLRFVRVALGDVVTRVVGAAPDALARVFDDARGKTPCLLFFDEFDAVAMRRTDLGTSSEQQVVNALLQQLDLHRDTPGLVIAAATNRLESLDPAVIRDGRFDYKVRVDKPDFGARREILRTLLAGRPAEPGIDPAGLAHETDGLTAAQLRSVVDRAALAALDGSRAITLADLGDARRHFLETHRYHGRRLSWDDIILPADVVARLQFVEQAMEHAPLARQLGVQPPSGVLLSGPPGTGKTTIARVLASQVDASFFVVQSTDVYSKWLGDSEQQVRQIFEQARAHAPALIFIDEIDALLAARGDGASGADATRHSVLNVFLSEMDGLDAGARVLIVGATNRPDLIDEAMLRPGRLGEHIRLGLPDAAERLALLRLFVRDMAVDAGVDLGGIAEATDGASGADLRGLCSIAGRRAFLREMAEHDDRVGVLPADFGAALAEWLATSSPARSAIGFRQA